MAVTQTDLNKQNEPSPADRCQIPWKGFAHSKRIDPLYVVIQRLSEWGVFLFVFFCWSVRCDPGGTLGLFRGVGTERDSCLVVFVTVGRPKSPRTLRGCRCSTLRNVTPPQHHHPRINPHVQSRGYLLRVKSGDDDTSHTHTHTHTLAQFPLYSVWTPRSTSITVSSQPWCHWYLWLICRGSNAEL